MFDFVAKHKRLLQLVLILLIVPPFAFFGIQNFALMVSGTDVAEVNGIKVTPQQLDRAMDEHRDQLRAALGAAFDPALLDTSEVRKQLLENLIMQRVISSYLARNQLRVTDDQVRDLILSEPAFEENGKFSRTRYQAFLRSRGESEEGFQARLRMEVAMRQLASGLVDSGIAAGSVAGRLAALRGERREVSEAMVTMAQFTSRVKLPPDAAEQYYNAHTKDFEAPEQIRAEYVELAQDAILAAESVEADKVKEAYEANLAPRHRERLEARKKVESLLTQARKEPAKFADLAKANSEDPGSAAQGGDLGWFGRGALVKPFEDAAFKLKENELSGVVSSEFGFHIIKLTGIRKAEGGKGEERRASHILINAPPEVKDFEAARPDIERDLKRQSAAKRFSELAESFSIFADDHSDDLQAVAEKFKLKVVTTGWFGRQAVPPVLNNPRLARALFTDDAIRNQRNTEAVETAPGKVIVARVVEHKPAAVRPLAEVRAQIEQKLAGEEALRLAREAGAERLKALETGGAPALKWSPPRTVSRDNSPGLDPRALAPIMGAATAKLPAYVGVDLPPNGYAIYRVSKVIAAPPLDEAKVRAHQTNLARHEAREIYEAFVGSLRDRAEIQIHEENVAKKER